MRKLIVSNMMTLDGFTAGPDGEIDWFVVDDEFFEDAPSMFDRIDTMLYGRETYQGMLSYWTSPEAIADDPFVAEKMNTTPKVVLSRTLDKAEWGEWDNARLLKGDIGEVVKNLKQAPGKDIIIYGSRTIVSQLTELGLIDEYVLFLNPVILGSGRPEFEGITRRVNLTLTDVKAYSNGLVRLVYVPS